MSLAFREIAFKGPNQHLEQLFDESCLYNAIKLLLSSKAKQAIISDWLYTSEESYVSADIHDPISKQQYSCGLGWPFNPQIQNCSCPQRKPCVHLAALAIESKMRLDRLPITMKEAQAPAPSWQGFQHWLTQQKHDPYPNMARHRLIYLLNRNEQGSTGWTLSVHKAYLSKQNEYQKKAEFSLAKLGKLLQEPNKLPKFVSLADQQILATIQQLIKTNDIQLVEDNQILAKQTELASLLKQLLATERFFWKACFRKPLKFHYQQENITENNLATLGDQYWLDNSQNLITKKMLADQQLIKDFSEHKPQACLSIESQSIKPKQTTNPRKNIDYARFYLQVGSRQYSLEQVIRQADFLDKSALELIAGYNQQLNWLASLALELDAVYSQAFNRTDRILGAPMGHWLPLINSLQQEGWQVKFANNFRCNQIQLDDWYLKLENSIQDGWFSLEIGVEYEQQKKNLLPHIVQLFQECKGDFEQLQQNYKVENNLLLLPISSSENILLDQQKVQQLFSVLLELLDKRSLNKSAQLELPKNQLSRINLLTENENQPTPFRWLGNLALKQKAQAVAASHRSHNVATPNKLQATLRDYQQQGLNWLQFLREHQLGGILADDMGLGKTLQTLAHISVEKEAGRLKKPALVVVPTSLLANWQQESERFVPSLKLLQLAGSKRHQHLANITNYDLVITSYGTLLRDVKLLQKTNFHLLILDEAQVIKNSKSQISRSVQQLEANFRLCLTGTPMENHLAELWSLFDFLMPRFLGTSAQFNRLYREPIEKQQDFHRQQALAKRIAPFVMRRTKAQVATELPDKIEIEQLIELETEQAELYETIRLSMSQEIQKLVTQDSGKANQLLIGNALLRLRQICCHPKLTPFESAQNIDESAKLNWLLGQLPTMLEEGRRILIFSSFTSMLDIISEQLEQLNIHHLVLTGKSRNRGQLIKNFQQEKAAVFLISLKAGGAGLNLTAADTVIHFDPWWNPAAEQQASDRAHRIGQDKNVFVYKLISKNTIEQKIQTLQKTKKSLADNIYQATTSVSSNLSQQDWLDIFSSLE